MIKWTRCRSLDCLGFATVTGLCRACYMRAYHTKRRPRNYKHKATQPAPARPREGRWEWRLVRICDACERPALSGGGCARHLQARLRAQEQAVRRQARKRTREIKQMQMSWQSGLPKKPPKRKPTPDESAEA